MSEEDDSDPDFDLFDFDDTQVCGSRFLCDLRDLDACKCFFNPSEVGLSEYIPLVISTPGLIPWLSQRLSVIPIYPHFRSSSQYYSHFHLPSDPHPFFEGEEVSLVAGGQVRS